MVNFWRRSANHNRLTYSILLVGGMEQISRYTPPLLRGKQVNIIAYVDYLL